jgi:SAM-dependent methyltransferase
MGKELDKDYYNKVFKNGGVNKTYFQEANLIKAYYPSWKMTYDYLKKNKINKIIDLGCGPGHFPSIFHNNDNFEYIGYDFSDVAIEHAKERNKNKNNFYFILTDLKFFDFTKKNFFYTSFEFLEHISFDLELLEKLNSGDEIIFSVPSYDSPGHVRFFENEKQVEVRYEKILNLKKLNVFINGKNKIYLYYGLRK